MVRVLKKKASAGVTDLAVPNVIQMFRAETFFSTRTICIVPISFSRVNVP